MNNQLQSTSPGQLPATQEEYLKKIAEAYEPAAQLVDKMATEPLTAVDELGETNENAIDQAITHFSSENDQEKLHVISEQQTKRIEQSEKTAVQHWTVEKPAEQH